MMKYLITFAAVLLVAQPFTVDQQWTWSQFKTTYHKLYKTQAEENHKLAVFQENLQKIEEHNKKYDQGLVSYKMGVNHFTDLTKEEFSNRFTPSKTVAPIPPKSQKFVQSPIKVDDEVDWRTKNAVTPVKNQGENGESWLFSITGTLESQNILVNNQSTILSENYLRDCVNILSNCQAGFMECYYEYLVENGMASEENYPNEAIEGQCKYTPADSVLNITSYGKVKPDSEEDLKVAVATVGPVSVIIDASNLIFYTEGVYEDDQCSANILNHGVLVVGYGTSDDGLDYWLIKNSWGASWGEEGYFRMVRNRNNQCGIASVATYPIL